MSRSSGLSQPDLEQRFAAYSGYQSTPDEALELFRLGRQAGCPVAHSDQSGGFHILMDYQEVRNAHRDWQTFSHEPWRSGRWVASARWPISRSARR